MVCQRHGITFYMWTGRFVSAYEYNGGRTCDSAETRARGAGAAEASRDVPNHCPIDHCFTEILYTCFDTYNKVSFRYTRTFTNFTPLF